MTLTDLRIDHRFRGPPHSGNGGYSAGLVAAALGGSDCEVTLWKPPPLDAPMRLERAGDEAVLLCGDDRIASGRTAELEIEVPPPPPFEAALEARSRFTGLTDHIFPACFVCGPDRAPGDGLRIFPGRLDPASERVAATWVPDASLADGEGRVRTEYLWAALDCPGYFAVEARAGRALLGRLAAKLFALARIGEPLVVTAWPLAGEGRKHGAGTALHDRSGRIVAAARATWVTLRD